MRRVFRRPRQRWIVPLLIVLVLGGLVGRVEASDGLRGDKCVVAENDYIAEDFYFFCRILEVRGTIDGDLLGIASEVTIERSAVITGDVWVAGGRVIISGTVGDDVHFAGISLSITDRAQFPNERTDALSIALNTELAQDAHLPGDLLIYGYQARVDGSLGGDIDFGGEALTIRGTVGGRVDASVGDARRSTDIPGLPIYDVSFSNPGLRVGEEAKIGGDLVYSSASRSRIPFGVVQGRVRYQQALSQPDITKAEQAGVAAQILKDYFIASFRDVLTLLIVGLIALRFMPSFVRQPAQHVRRRVIPTIGWGLITFMISFPLAIVLLLISLLILLILFLISLSELTIITAVGLLVVNLALIGGFWFLLLFMGRVVVSFVFGELVYRYGLRVPQNSTYRRRAATLLIGAVIYALLANIPLPPLGLIIELITALAGIGAVMMYVRSLVNLSEAVTTHLPAPLLPVLPARAPMPPVTESGELPPGMNNLPEGFSGFDENW